MLSWDDWYQFHCNQQSEHQVQESEDQVEVLLQNLQVKRKKFDETEAGHNQPTQTDVMPVEVEEMRSEQAVQTTLSLLPALLTSSSKYYSPDDLQATIDSLVSPIARERDYAEGLLRSAGLELDITGCSESKLQQCVDNAEVCDRMERFAEDYERNGRQLSSLSAIFDRLATVMTKLPPIMTQVDRVKQVAAYTAAQIVRMRTLKQAAGVEVLESDMELGDQDVQSCTPADLSGPFRLQGVSKRRMAQPKRKKKR